MPDRRHDRVSSVMHVMHLGSRRLLVPVNGSAGDLRAIDLVADLGTRNHVELTLVYVIEVPQMMPLDAELPGEIDMGEQVLSASEQYARSLLDPSRSMIESELLQARSAGAAIVDEAKVREATDIVIATENRQHFGKVAIGDTATYVMLHAACDVIVLRLAGSNARQTGSQRG